MNHKVDKDVVKMLLVVAFTFLVCTLIAVTCGSEEPPQVQRVQRLQDSGDTNPVFPPIGVMTKKEMVEYIQYLQDQLQKFQDGLMQCSDYYIPRIMVATNTNISVFLPVTCIEQLVTFLDSAGCQAFLIWDSLVDMRLQEGDISFEQKSEGS